MVVFPLISTLVSLTCAVTIARDAIRRPRPEKIAWAIAFGLFAAGAGAEALAGIDEWTPFLVRIFYLTGAVLVVGYLGLGELYLLAPARMQAARFVPGLALLGTAIAATLVWSASIDKAKLADDGWKAMDRGPGLIIAVALASGLGTVVIVGGALYSAWRFRKLGIERHRLNGCLLIALGTLIVASKGSLARTGLPEETFALAMAVGVAIIFTGYLESRRPDPARATAGVAAPASLAVSSSAELGQLVPEPAPTERPGIIPLWRQGRTTATSPAAATAADPGIAFIEERFLPLDSVALAEACRIWSVPPSEADAFTRDEARRVWALRLRLSAAGQAAFDAHPAPAQLQLASLYHEILAAEVATLRHG